jgi:glucoamylase
LLSPAMVHWSVDNWQTAHDFKTHSSGIGVHFVDLPTQSLESGRTVVFTFLWDDSQRWEGADFSVTIDGK